MWRLPILRDAHWRITIFIFIITTILLLLLFLLLLLLFLLLLLILLLLLLILSLLLLLLCLLLLVLSPRASEQGNIFGFVRIYNKKKNIYTSK